MKSLIVLSAMLIGCALAYPLIRGNSKGQPGCKTPKELKVRLYPYHDDPQFYWECVRKDKDAICRYCPIGTLFQPSLAVCVRAQDYRWQENYDPPSLPDVILRSCSIPIVNTRPTNGQPGCKTQKEVQKRYHPNPDDITRYWECPGLNKVAICRKCRDATVFELNKCVTAGTETWRPFAPPASSPDVLVKCKLSLSKDISSYFV